MITSYNASLNNVKTNFNICKYATYDSEYECDNDKDLNKNTLGYLFDKDKKKCYGYSDKDSKYAFEVPEDSKNKLFMTITNSDTSKTLIHKVKFTIACKSDNNSQELKINNDKSIDVILNSKENCIFTVNIFYNIFNKFAYIIFIVFIAIGSILNFFGKYLYRKLIIVLGFLIGFSLAFSLFFVIIDNERNKLALNIVKFAISLVFAAVLGYIFKKIEKVNIIISSVFISFIISFIVYIFILRNLILFIMIFIIILGINIFCGFKYYKKYIILSTSVIGSYIMVKFIFIFFSDYINEFMIIDILRNKDFNKLPKINIVSYIFYLLFLISGIIIQIVFLKKKGFVDIDSEDMNDDFFTKLN